MRVEARFHNYPGRTTKLIQTNLAVCCVVQNRVHNLLHSLPMIGTMSLV